MARIYNGVFSPFFYESRVRTILENANQLEHLSGSALAVGASWADRLLETSPIPLQPSKHLEVQSFRPITLEGELDFYSQSPWLAWVEALDLICLGPWAGFRPDTNIKMVEALQHRVTKRTSNVIALENELLGRKVNLPMYSRGLQGVVVGVFTDVPKNEMEPILTSLMQFGETLSDAYSDLRLKAFSEALEGELDEEALAREVINVVSPIAKIIVSREGRQAGYKIGTESIYWAGYERMSPQQLNEKRSGHGFSVVGPHNAEIYIETLTDIPHLNPEFTRIRLENSLTKIFGSISIVTDGPVLPFAEIRQLREELEANAAEDNVSLAKLRQYFVVQKIEKHWHRGAVRVTNSEMKSYLEGRGRDAKNGYQVTSFVAEFEKIFTDKVIIAKTRNALSLSWSKSASAPPNKSRNT
jgi:hypothetical protein